MSTLIQTIKNINKTFDRFTERGGGMKMWPYQLEPAKAILNSIKNDLGLTFVIVISRQSGKDEMLANLLAYILTLYAHREAGVVVVNPTYKPQTENSLLRLENRLSTNLMTQSFWKKRGAYMRRIGKAIGFYLSGDKETKVAGATASKLLAINEAQDIHPGKYDKDFAPMGTYYNVTRVFLGTVWTTHTLLAREEDTAREAEKQDGIRRVFFYTSDDVRKHNKNYGKYVDSEVKKLGRQHPLVKTQYFCERIDAQAGMFNARRLALMQGDQPEQTQPIEGHVYAFTIDVAGMDETMLELEGMRNPGRDKTTLSIDDIDLSELNLLQNPIYRVVNRFSWHGSNHVDVFGAVCSLIDNWQPLYIIIDATGVGEGLWAMFAKKYPTRTIPIKFTAQTKSEIGYGFIAAIESGRFRDCSRTEEVRLQYANCQSEILIGPAKTMRWGVPDGTRDQNGQLIHDDFISADSMIAELDKLEWHIHTDTEIVEGKDPLQEMSRAY